MTAEATNPYAELVAAGCEIDSHESDLYAKATPEALEIVKRSGWSFTKFRHEGTGDDWLDIPFAFMPFWEKRGRVGA